MSERTLADRLHDALFSAPGVPVNEARLAIETALVLARREGALKAAGALVPGFQGKEQFAANLIPIPSRTVGTLREESDPEGMQGKYRYNDAARRLGTPAIEELFTTSEAEGWRVAHSAPTAKRIDLWADLKRSPYREVSVPVDPDEILP